MLLNLTNHPSINWPSIQINTAISNFGSIQDLSFPAIPPEYTSSELDALVDTYLAEIVKLSPSAVHIMGEMTFTHRLVNRLKSKGITCIASTTSRITEEVNGIKLSKFTFVQFREY
jgi:hypothetical protein